MGMMALLRQMYLDLDWYKKGNSETKDLSLEALANNEKLVQIFTTEDKLNSLRAAKIAKEFGLTYILKGNGNEFDKYGFETSYASGKLTGIINLAFVFLISSILSNSFPLPFRI